MSDRNNNSFRDFGNLSSLEDQKLKSASSVNSQEFIQQIESRWQDAVEKKQQKLQPFNGKPSILADFLADHRQEIARIRDSAKKANTRIRQQEEVEDELSKNEQLEYLQFKQQVFVKRLLELRQMHTKLLEGLPEIREKLIDAVQRLVNKAETSSIQLQEFVLILPLTQSLKEQELELSQQLKNIQHEMDVVKTASQTAVFKATPSKSAVNKFAKLQERLVMLERTITTWSLRTEEPVSDVPFSRLIEEIRIESGKKMEHKKVAAVLASAAADNSPIRKIRYDVAPSMNQLDSLLQSLNQQQRSAGKVQPQQYRQLNTQSIKKSNCEVHKLLDRQQGLFKDQKKQSVKGSESNLQREFQKSEGLKSSALLIDEIKNPQHLTGVQTVLAKQSNLFFSQKFRR